MKDLIVRWVTVVVTSVVALTMFESLLPGDNTKKASMFIGRLVFLLSVLSIISSVYKDWNRDIWPAYHRYSLEMGRGTALYAVEDEDVQKQLIEDLYYENTCRAVESFVRSIAGVAACRGDVILNRSEDPALYGKIERIVVSVVSDQTGAKLSKEQLERKIGEYFMIDPEYVYVSVE